MNDFFKSLSNWLEKNLLFFFLAGLIGAVPFVVFMRVVDYDAVSASIYGRGNTVDFFTYYRALWIYIIAGFGLFLFFWKAKPIKTGLNGFLFSYAFFNIISAVFAQHRQIAIWGDPTRHEGLLIHLCYMACVFLFFNYVKDENSLRKVVGVLAISSFLLSIVGLLQFCGHDYFFGSFTRKHLIPESLLSAGVEKALTISENPWNSIFLTFGNGNFTGSYMTMLFSLSLVSFFLAKGGWRYPVLIWNCFLFMNLVGSKSRAGIAGAILAGFVMLLFFRNYFKRFLKTGLLLMGLYFFLVAGMEIYTVGSGKPGLIQTSVGRSASSPTAFWGNFDGVELGKEKASVSFDGLKLTLHYNDEKVEFLDKDGVVVPYKLLPKSLVASKTAELRKESEARVASGGSEINIEIRDFSADLVDQAVDMEILPALSNPSGTLELKENEQYLVIFPDNEFRGFAVLVQPSINLFNIGRGGGTIYLALGKEGFQILNHNGQPTGIVNAEAFGFKGRERFASGRGYIWSRTIPMLKKAILVGYGPDTFVAHFPHFDCVERMKHWGTMQIIMEKPHNMFLQIGVNSGVISLFVVILFFLGYVLNCFQLYWNCSFNSLSKIFGFAVFIGFLAYCAAGFFNDSLNSVAPVFWSLLGTGLACNRLNLPIEKDEKDEKEID